MAKIKPVPLGNKGKTSAKARADAKSNVDTKAALRGALPCLFLVLIAFLLIGLLFYAMMTSTHK